MATPIKITPILKDETSRKFNESFNAQKEIKVSEAEKKKIDSLVEKVLSNSKLK